MRKLLLALLLAASFTGAFAQKLDDVKEKIEKQKWDEAKEKIDKAMQDAKAATNTTAWFYKAQVYQNLSKTHPDDPSYATTAMEAMKMYLSLGEKEPEGKRNLLSTLENNATAYDIYTSYFKAGADNYNNKEYQKAFDNFEKALAAFDLLKKYNFTTVPHDTTSILYAGVSAEQSKNTDNAIKYYTRLVEMKIPDTTYRGVYEYVVDYYMKKKDEANTRKYLTLGESVFPNYGSWLAYELDMVGEDKTKRLAKYDELLERYPSNKELWNDYAIEYFTYTYSNDNNPSDYEERKVKLGEILKKLIEVAPSPQANYNMRTHINNQIADLENAKRTIKGTTPADVAKKKEIDAKIAERYEDLHTYAQNVYNYYSQQTELKPVEKVYYKEVIKDLVSYYQIKKDMAKATEYQNKLKTIQ